jgi:LPS O-antigen subunit length determinant protein (WzzB/FepE family)
MSLVTTLYNQKTHIIYIAILLGVIGVAYNLLSNKPKEIIKTQVVTKVETKEVKVATNTVTHRVTQTKKLDGEIVTETEDIVDKGVTTSKDKENLSITKTEVQKFLSKYTLSAFYPLTTKDILNPVFNPANLQIVGGMRVFSLPILLNVGASVKLDTVLVGVTVEL